MVDTINREFDRNDFLRRRGAVIWPGPWHYSVSRDRKVKGKVTKKEMWLSRIYGFIHIAETLQEGQKNIFERRPK